MNQTLYMNASLEFTKPLTEYAQLIWIKLAYYTRDFEVNIESLKSEIDSFCLERPKEKSLEDVLKILQESKSITFIDSDKPKLVTLTNDLNIRIQDITRQVDDPNYIIKWDNSYKYPRKGCLAKRMSIISRESLIFAVHEVAQMGILALF